MRGLNGTFGSGGGEERSSDGGQEGDELTDDVSSAIADQVDCRHGCFLGVAGNVTANQTQESDERCG